MKESKRSYKKDPVCEAVKLMRCIVENDPAKAIINVTREDVQKARQHELQCTDLTLLVQSSNVCCCIWSRLVLLGFYHGCYWVFLYLTILCFMALTGVHSYRGGECYLLPTNYLLYPNPWSGQEMQCPQLGFFSSKARSSTTTQPHHKNMKISLFKRRKKF